MELTYTAVNKTNKICSIQVQVLKGKGVQGFSKEKITVDFKKKSYGKVGGFRREWGERNWRQC